MILKFASIHQISFDTSNGVPQGQKLYPEMLLRGDCKMNQFIIESF